MSDCLQRALVIFSGMEAVVIEREAMRLPEVERALLAERLLESLDTKRPMFEGEWLEESRERFAAYKAGALEAVDGQTAVAEIRKSISP